MAHWPLPARPTTQLSTMRNISGTVATTTVTASATAHTKGAWTELVASTAAEVTLLDFHTGNTHTAATNTDTLLDLGIGPAGSEIVVVANLQVGWSVAKDLRIPLMLPAGTRIAARAQSVVASKAVTVGVDLYGGAALSGGPAALSCVTYGADTAASQGVLVTSGTANNFGSWVELVASTSDLMSELLVTAGGNSTVGTGQGFQVQLATGAAASEQMFHDGPCWTLSSSEEATPLTSLLIPLSRPIPAGTRIAARARSNTASSTMRLILHGLKGY